MAVKYTLSFSSNAGANIEYELDILDEDYSGLPTTLKGQPSPITIEWKTDRDIYAPIMGSKASINLLIEDGDVIDDFNSAAPFTYEVRLRYKDSDDNLHDVWRGWIEPNDGEERVGSFPFPVSYVATDGMANLDRPVRSPDERGDVLLLHYILYALEQTGLGLDVLIDSSIINDNQDDGLLVAKVNELAFMEESTDQVYPQIADSRKEVLEGILSAFNCTVRQANGKFYIFNNSDHGGTGDNESKTWKVYEYDASASDKIDGTNYKEGDDFTEDLLYTLTGDSSSDLYVKNESLFLIPRYPIGSVEARFQDLRPVQLVPNPRFGTDTESSQTGWQPHANSIDQTLVLEDTDSVNGYAIKTDRTRFEIDNTGEIWFEIDPDYAKTISREFPATLEFDWLALFDSNDVRAVELQYAVYVQFSSNITMEDVFSGLSWNPLDWLFGNPIQRESYTTNRLYHHSGDSRWKIDKDNGGYNSFYTTKASTDKQVWQRETVELGAIGETVRSWATSEQVPDEDPKIYIRFWYPEAKRTDKRNYSNSTSRADVYVDNVSIKPSYTGEDARPVFERVQDNYTTTIDYRPRIIGDNVLSQQFYEILDTTSFWESDQDPDLITARGLEELVTNQKLSDWRFRLPYYEATFVNRSDVPISQQNKIKLDLDEHSQTRTLIQNGGTFDPKTGEYKVGMYVPGTGGLVGDFYRYDVTLIGQDPPVRDNSRTYVVGFNFSAVDDEGNPIVDPDDPDNTDYKPLIPTQYWDIGVGVPGQTYSRSFVIQANSDWEIDGTITLRDTADNPAPTYMRSVNIERIGSNVQVSYQIEIPEEDEYEEATFDAVLDELVGDNSRVVLSASNDMTNATIQQGGGNITEIGPIGSTERFLYYIVPNDTYQMLASAFTVTLDSVKDGPNASDTDVAGVVNASDIDVIQSGTGLIVSIPFTYQETSPVYVKLSFSGIATTIPSTSTTQLQVTASESGSDTSNWSITDPDITLTCVPGTPLTYIFELNPESGRVLPPGNVSVGSIEEGPLGGYYVTGEQAGSSESLVFLEATCPTTSMTGDDAASITISATTIPSAAGENLNSYGITWTDPDNTTTNNAGSGQTFELLEGQTSEFILSLEADTGYNLGDIDIDTENLPAGLEYNGRQDFGDYDEVEITDFFFTVVGQGEDSTGNVIPFNTGTAGEANNKYTLLFNISAGDDSGNATPSTTLIRVPFGLADVGEGITSRTFTIYSSDSTMRYGETSDVSFTVTEDDDHNGAFACSATSISDGVITATITGTLPDADNLPEDAIAEVDIVIGGPAMDIIPASSGGTTFSKRTAGIPSSGGTAVFELDVDGGWNASIHVTGKDSAGVDNDTGTFTLNVGPVGNPSLLTTSGSYGPTTGGAGRNNLISLQVGEEPLYMNPSGNTGLSSSFFSDTAGIQYELRIHSRNPDGSDGDQLASATINQAGQYGGRSYTVPSTWSASEVENWSGTTSKPSWTFYVE